MCSSSSYESPVLQEKFKENQQQQHGYLTYEQYAGCRLANGPYVNEGQKNTLPNYYIDKTDINTQIMGNSIIRSPSGSELSEAKSNVT